MDAASGFIDQTQVAPMAPRPRRLLARCCGRVVALMTATIAAATWVAATAPAVGAATECARVSGRVVVAVVVDDGKTVNTTCVDVEQGDSSAVALRRRAEKLGVPAPRYDASGLMCAIDGYPATGCGEPDGSGAYLYWSYWWGGDGGWRYASSGPASHKVTDGSVEGWRFIRGRGTGTENAPRADATFRWAVPATTPGATHAPTSSPPPAPAPAPVPGRPATPQRPGAPAPTVTASPVPAPDTPALPSTVPADVPATSSPDTVTITTGADTGDVPVEVEGATAQRPKAARPVEKGGFGWQSVLIGLGAVAVVSLLTVASRRKRAAP